MYIDIIHFFNQRVKVEETNGNKYNINKLSKELSISYDATKRIFNKESDAIKFKTLESICNVLNCTPNDILKFGKPQDD